MKKIIKIMIFVLAFFITTNNCYAKEIIVGEKIPNIKLHLKFDNIDEDRNIYELIDKDTKELLFNIAPEETNYDFFYTNYDFHGGLNKLPFAIQEEIARFAYFGYGYKNRTDKKWYAVTQYLIWEKIIENKGGEIYFIDESNNRISIYQSEIEEIKQDISDFGIIPSFTSKNYQELKITLNDKLVLEDTNKVLDSYDIETTNEDFIYEIKDDTMTIIPKTSNIIGFTFFKKIEDESEGQVYNALNKSILMSKGTINKTVSFLYVNARKPILIFKSNPLNNLELKDQEFTLYWEDNNVWYTVKFNEEGISNEFDLYPGKYYLINTNTPYGYKKVERIDIEIKKDDVTIEIPNELITKNVALEYRIISDDTYKIGENKVLEIYSNKKLIKEIKTNKDGIAYLNLGFGTYEVKGKDSEESLVLTIDENYEEFKPLIFEEKEIIEDSNNKEDNIDIPNDQENNNNDILNTDDNKEDLIVSEKGTITINKIDAKTGLALANIRFGLFNKDKTLIASNITDSNGKIIFKDLDTGTYYLKEMLNDEDYSLGDDYYEVEVKSDINTILTNTNHTAIKVPDTYQEVDHSYFLIIFLISLYGFKKKF